MPGKYDIPPITAQVLCSELLRNLPQAAWDDASTNRLQHRPDFVGKVPESMRFDKDWNHTCSYSIVYTLLFFGEA